METIEKKKKKKEDCIIYNRTRFPIAILIFFVCASEILFTIEFQKPLFWTGFPVQSQIWSSDLHKFGSHGASDGGVGCVLCNSIQNSF